MADDADLKKQLDEAMAVFQEELKRLQIALDADIAQIIAEAKQKQIEEIKQSLNQANG
jgi:hypothetical protein